MKIDAECINHNAMLLIKEASEKIYSTKLHDNSQDINLKNVSYIQGVCALAESLKEVLKL